MSAATISRQRSRIPGPVDTYAPPTSLQPPIVSSNLVLWLDAGSSASYPGTGTTWTDISPSAFSCLLINSPIYNAGNGGYFTFNGRDTYGFIASNAAFAFGTGDFTVEAWVWVNSRSDTYQHLGGTHNGGVGQGWYTTLVNAGPYHVNTNQDLGFGYFHEGNGGLGLMPIGVWKHVVFCRIGGMIRFYRDTVVGPTVLNFASVSIENFGNPLLIGAIKSNGLLPVQGDDGLYNLKGRIAQFRIYKGKGLTQAEVTNNYNAHISRYS